MIKKIFCILICFVALCFQTAFAEQVQKWHCKLVTTDEMWVNNVKQVGPNDDKKSFPEFIFYYNPNTKQLYSSDKKSLIKNVKIINNRYYFDWLKDTQKNMYTWSFVVDRNTNSVEMDVYTELGYVKGMPGYIVMKTKGFGTVNVTNENW